MVYKCTVKVDNENKVFCGNRLKVKWKLLLWIDALGLSGYSSERFGLH